MKIFKNVFAIVLSLSLIFCMVGCSEGDEYDNFVPAGVCVVESINGAEFETMVEDAAVAQKMWDIFDDLMIDTDQRGEIGSAYLYMCFYNEDQSTLAIFTIYENGSCCLGEDFATFYTVDDGADIFVELCDIYTEYEAQNTNK